MQKKGGLLQYCVAESDIRCLFDPGIRNRFFPQHWSCVFLYNRNFMYRHRVDADPDQTCRFDADPVLDPDPAQVVHKL